MDAELKFYKHNRLLLRFLVITSVVFFVIVGLIFWQDKDNAPAPTEESTTFQHFSERAAVSEVTYAYKAGAKYITDIESYPEIKELFFSGPIPTYTDEAQLRLALDEVNEATSSATDFSNTNVNSASYYIGNLLILPGLALHNLLLSEQRPYTTQLLETALADVRSGTVTIQNYFDEATPNFYNPALKPAVYFPTPSFPSLTVVEAATVLYVLAGVDKVHARFYEQQIKDYASQVFSSGSNFKVDIEYALKLAVIYDSIRQTIPEYVALNKAAEGEWTKTPEVTTRTNIRPAFNFKTTGFPYLSNQQFVDTENWGYEPSYKTEDLAGSLRLTLVDDRLTPKVAKLYEFNFADNSILPLAIDLRTKEFPVLNSSVGRAHYLATDDYTFLTGTLSSDISWINGFTDTKLVKREGNKVSDLGLRLPASSMITNLSFSPASAEVLLTKSDLDIATNLFKTSIERFVPGSGDKPAFVDSFAGDSASYFDATTAVFVEDGVVKLYDFGQGKSTNLNGIPNMSLATIKRSTKFFAEQGILVVSDEIVDYKTLVPSTWISFYKIEKNEDGDYQASKKYKTVLTDAEIYGIELSPAGRYLAVSATTGLNQAKAKVLIFDTISGIIKKEIDLSAFAGSSLWFDQWVTSDPS